PVLVASCILSLFIFARTATAGLYTLSLHDALPIYDRGIRLAAQSLARYCIQNLRPLNPPVRPSHRREALRMALAFPVAPECYREDRKSTRLNSSHVKISYAVFCLKKKKCKLRSVSP